MSEQCEICKRWIVDKEAKLLRTFFKESYKSNYGDHPYSKKTVCSTCIYNLDPEENKILPVRGLTQNSTMWRDFRDWVINHETVQKKDDSD